VVAEEEEDEEYDASFWKTFSRMKMHHLNTLYGLNLPITWFWVIAFFTRRE
jgi:hypothetical protein